MGDRYWLDKVRLRICGVWLRDELSYFRVDVQKVCVY